MLNRLQTSSTKNLVAKGVKLWARVNELQKQKDQQCSALYNAHRAEVERLEEEYQKAAEKLLTKMNRPLEKASKAALEHDKKIEEAGIIGTSHDGRKSGSSGYYGSSTRAHVLVADLLEIADDEESPQFNEQDSKGIALDRVWEERITNLVDSNMATLSNRYTDLKNSLTEQLQAMWGCDSRDEFRQQLQVLNEQKRNLISLHDELRPVKAPNECDKPFPEI